VPDPAPLRLEPFAEHHLPALDAVLADAEVLRFTRIPEPVPPDFARSWLARYERGREAGTSEAFAALGGGNGTFVGLALAPTIDREAGEVELGYLVTPAARGRGVATAMLRVLTDWALNDLGAQRAYLIVDVTNGASQTVAERAGYVREGVLRSLHVKQDRRADCIVYSRLPSDG
jgi:RimJ/RimL family protein N-acetyltransferase